MTASPSRETTAGCSSTKKKRNAEKGKDDSYSDSDSDSLFNMPDPIPLAKELIYSTPDAMVLGEVLAEKPFLIERPIDDDSFTNWGLKQILRDRQLLGTVKLPKSLSRVLFEKNVVREFYANLDARPVVNDSDRYRRVFIRGKYYEFNPTLLNRILETKNRGTSPMRVCDEILLLEMTGGKIHQWPAAGLRRTHLTKFYAVLHEIGCSNWFPTNILDDVSVDQALVLYSVGRGMEFNLGEFIFKRILEDSRCGSDVICFPILIFALLSQQDFKAPNNADLNVIEPTPIGVTPELNTFHALVANQMNVISYEFATFQTQIQSFFEDGRNELPGQPPA